MQGHTVSSEAIWTAFNNATTAFSRILKWAFKVAWKRVSSGGGFAQVGTSVVDGLDVVQGLNDILTEADKFVFYDETDRLLRFEWDRILQEPLGGMAMCLADVVLENADSKFTPSQNATIGTAILPNRPMQMSLGFLVSAVEKVVSIFKGLSRQPRENKLTSTISISAIDYVQFLNEYSLESTIYTDQRSDQIIQDILNTIGFGSSQFSLDVGLNTIGFAWFEKGQTAGERIRRICEAEEAIFYQDENGLLRFENRRHFSESPHNISVWDIDPEDIVAWEQDESTKIINRVIVKAKPRAVQAQSEIWRDGIEEEIGQGETREIWANFEDPVSSVVTPVVTTDYTAFSATGGAGTDVSSKLTVGIQAFTKAVKITISHTHGGPIFVNLLRLRGTAATVTSEIEEIFQDDTSISKYQRSQLEIQNDFIDDRSFAYYLARAVVRKYKEPRRRLVLTVQGIPQVQLRDRIKVKDIDLNTYKDYRLMRIQGILDNGLFLQKLTLREVVSGEADSWAIVGTTQVASETEFVGS